MRILIVSILLAIYSGNCEAQDTTEAGSFIEFYIDLSVTNAEEAYFKEVYSLWTDYLRSYQYLTHQNGFWGEQHILPDYPYAQLCMHLRAARQENQKVFCNILAIVPVENDYYMIKSMFTKQGDAAGHVHLEYISSVYAKKINGSYSLINSTLYHKELWENQTVGNINYIIHPAYQFDMAKAIKMNEFNTEMANAFEIEPIQFDYVVTNNTIQLSKLIGYDFFQFSYMPIQSGGMADTYNRVIYAGNNSTYYPHEVVHLYVDARFRGLYHSWTNEGVAAFFGGSTGYHLDWHVQKLKTFLEENPDYPINDLSALETNIPNGEFMTDMRYAIGGYLCKKIYEMEGMQGLFDALQSGRMDDNYFEMIDSKLGIDHTNFGKYIKDEMKKQRKIYDFELEKLKY